MKKQLNLMLKSLVVLVFLTTLSGAVMAQKPPVKRKTTAVVVPVNNTSEVRVAAEKVSIQIKNISKFVYLLGGYALTIESLDKESKTRKLSQTSIDANNKLKQAVIQGIRNIRAGMVALEIDFRTKPQLKNYNFQLQGISDLTGRAEDLAVGGQFSESGKSLLLVIEKLSDTLVAMP